MGGNADGVWTIIYDGGCRFCTAGAGRLASWFPAGSVELIDYHQPGALARFPSITREACDEAMHLVNPLGRIFRGAEAVARAVGSRGLLGRLALVYYVPGVRWVCDRLYAVVAANRYRIAGRTDGCEACRTGSCRRPGS